MTNTAQTLASAGPAIDHALNFATMTANQVMATLSAAGIGGVALEQALEKFGIDKAPAKLKPYIPVVFAIGGTAGVAMSQGMPPMQALGLGVGTWVVSQLKHDHAPAVTPDGAGAVDQVKAPADAPAASSVQVITDKSLATVQAIHAQAVGVPGAN